MNKSQFMARLFDRPALIEPAACGFFFDQSFSGSDQSLDLSNEIKLDAVTGSSTPRTASSFYQVVNGVAIIPVEGALIHRFGLLNPFAGMTGYDGITFKANLADQDPDVKGIFFDVDSDGGQVSGCFDTARLISAIDKPTMAFIDESAHSAAYAIACACDEVVLPRTGSAGSVGVVFKHRDVSKAAQKAGLKFEFVYRGKHKIDGNPFEALSPEVKGRLQEKINETGEQFEALVAENRRMSVDQVSGLEALTFSGEKAVEAGLADAVMSKAEAFSTFNDFVHSDSPNKEITTMSNDKESVISAEQLSADIAEAERNASTSATAKEQDRIFAIIGSKEAEGRADAAIELAKAGLDADVAITTLSKLPKEEKVEASVSATDLLNAEGGAGVEGLAESETKELTAGQSLINHIKEVNAHG